MPLLDEIPGLREAVEKEQFIRDAAFQPVNEFLGGFEVRPMTLRQYLLLRLAKSPLLVESVTPTPVQLAAFLWLLSPAYEPKFSRAKRQFNRRTRLFLPPPKPLLPTKRAMARWERKVQAHFFNFTTILAQAREYVAHTMMDRPPVPSTMVNEEEPDYYSDAAYLCGLFAREYGWPENDVLEKPLSRLFQYLNEIRRAHGAKVMFNPSDKVKGDWLWSRNQELQAEAARN